MTEVVLDNLIMKRESKSYVDSLHAVLTHAGLFQGSKYGLAGYTGMAFKLSVHRRLLHLSVTAYGQWGESHRQGIDNLGLFTISDGGRTRHPTFEYYQQDAVNWVKRSLDGGIGVIYWIPEFGVIHGYDDSDRIFYVQDGWSKEPQILLYDNFGLNFTGFWYCQVFGEQVHIPEQQMLLESLRLAIEDWDIPFRLLPDQNIASADWRMMCGCKPFEVEITMNRVLLIFWNPIASPELKFRCTCRMRAEYGLNWTRPMHAMNSLEH
ncbi:hypothetical protein [Paenibacillus sp. 1A_MP2]|uniref:hypothetical protein n=1 Tax=Paenibacillus sp. 1A_MP2 TaxID=3457495 RepID=UPI003FCDE3EB